MTKIVLIIGSAPDAVRAGGMDRASFEAVVAVNNAWRIRPDWTHLVHAGDFPDQRKPAAGLGQAILSYEAYVPANNAYGGIVLAGATMAFSTAYWALDTLRPEVMAFIGCDMIYDQTGGKSHFYGHGSADPLRPDPTLQDLEAKSNRLMLLAAHERCLCVNLSELPNSRLTFPRVSWPQLEQHASSVHRSGLRSVRGRIQKDVMKRALECETAIGLVAPEGDYWNDMDALDSSALSAVDALWRSSVRVERPAAIEAVGA
ncbi:hypothetical protein [Oricola sp.]|uniref:hypothetical protein n=1 Tax=Oricola sp. TaxID=1979950 RepID=UPI003511B682